MFKTNVAVEYEERKKKLHCCRPSRKMRGDLALSEVATRDKYDATRTNPKTESHVQVELGALAESRFLPK